jgi:hypothetical protein
MCFPEELKKEKRLAFTNEQAVTTMVPMIIIVFCSNFTIYDDIVAIYDNFY